ncbi:AMP-binding protein [Echinicola sp. CAU 1574]|uniref:AMP-binding protein n=1 Tax=Echinicola arenosa TaxID=2774144 RepID=A0ABR9AFI5_9BACT|nr:AMP-binding protein [Echinicola arenosa]MBD8487602.1 AMP-binding protein [Echinicola arenosa]
MIIIEDHQLTFETIKKGDWSPFPPYFQESLLFCKDWLNGKEEFKLQTSGSTGKPKTISIKRIQMENSAKATGDFFKITPDSKLLCCLNTAMIAGKMMLVRAMEWKSKIHLIEPNGLPLKSFSQNQKFDFVAMVPAQIENCLSDIESTPLLKNINSLIIGGAPLSNELQKEIAKLPCNSFQTYGMTETVSHIALAKISGTAPLVYRVLPGVEINTNENNQLVIKAPMALHPLTTNDIVKIISPQEFIWKGRSDFTINSGGIKIQPEEIEKLISSKVIKHFNNSRYFISSGPHSKWGEQVVLIIESQEPSDWNAANFKKELRVVLEKYACPKKVYFIENFIETTSGKINRHKTAQLTQ